MCPGPVALGWPAACVASISAACRLGLIYIGLGVRRGPVCTLLATPVRRRLHGGRAEPVCVCARAKLAKSGRNFHWRQRSSDVGAAGRPGPAARRRRRAWITSRRRAGRGRARPGWARAQSAASVRAIQVCCGTHWLYDLPSGQRAAGRPLVLPPHGWRARKRLAGSTSLARVLARASQIQVRRPGSARAGRQSRSGEPLSRRPAPGHETHYLPRTLGVNVRAAHSRSQLVGLGATRLRGAIVQVSERERPKRQLAGANMSAVHR